MHTDHLEWNCVRSARAHGRLFCSRSWGGGHNEHLDMSGVWARIRNIRNKKGNNIAHTSSFSHSSDVFYSTVYHPFL